jgi:hypothetical protein
MMLWKTDDEVRKHDDPGTFGARWLIVGLDRLYLSVRQAEVDIWVADVEVER